MWHMPPVTPPHMRGPSWRRVAPQLRALPSYLALLRSHELPTLVVSALDAAPSPLFQRDDHELRAIMDILVRMIENKWAFATTAAVTSEQQRLLDYAHDWASETLLALLHTAGHGGDSGWERAEASHAALDAMQRALFGLCPHAAVDQLSHTEAALEDALSGHVVDDMEPQSVRQLLETCALSVHEDATFTAWLERLTAVRGPRGRAPRAVAVGPACWKRLLTPNEEAHRLLDALSLRARVVVWASDAAQWLHQLDEWLVEVHAAPFRAIAAVLGVARAELVAPPVASQLHVALVAWATRPSRRRWLRASRSRALVAAVARLVHDREACPDAYGRRLLGTVPRVLLAQQDADAPWTRPQRAHVLHCVAQRLAALPDVGRVNNNARAKRQGWLEFLGLLEQRAIVQCALDSLLTPPGHNEWDHACAIIVWHECLVYGVRGETDRATIARAVHETSTGLGGAGWRDAVAWLQLHRSSAFATCTLTRLRITWRWLVQECTADNEAVSLSDALESVEYALRRFAPADDTRRFQVEVIAVLVEDLEWWCSRHRRGETAAFASLKHMQTLRAWLQKLVRLLPTADATAVGSASLSQQLEERLDAMM